MVRPFFLLLLAHILRHIASCFLRSSCQLKLSSNVELRKGKRDIDTRTPRTKQAVGTCQMEQATHAYTTTFPCHHQNRLSAVINTPKTTEKQKNVCMFLLSCACQYLKTRSRVINLSTIEKKKRKFLRHAHCNVILSRFYVALP